MKFKYFYNRLLGRSLLAILLALIYVISLAVPVWAETIDREERALNLGANWYQPVSASASSTACQPGQEALVGGSNAEKIWNWLTAQGLAEHQAAGIMGNISVESSYSPTRHEDGKPWSIGGWGLVQWTAGRRTAIASAMPSDIKPFYDDRYGDALPGDAGGKHPSISEEDNVKILNFELEFMVQESKTRKVSSAVASQGYGRAGANEWETLKQQDSVEDAAVFWHNNFEVSAQSAASVLETRLPAANQAIQSFSGSGGSAADCSNSTILTTIKNLAWPYSTVGMSTNSQAKPEYQEAAMKHFGNSCYGGSICLADCTFFVATVMRESGVDPDFPIGTDAIRAYLTSNPDKYEVIVDPKISDMQPGDILQHITAGSSIRGSWSGHIMFYTGEVEGDNGTTYYGADASKYTRVPGYLSQDSVNDMFSHSSLIIARPKS